MAEDRLGAFRAFYLSNREAFERHDWASAFRGLPEDFEWHPFEIGPQPEAVRGPDGVRAFFEELTETFPDWDAEALEFIEAGEDHFLVRCTGRGTSAVTGVALDTRFTQVWELEGGRLIRVREFTRHGDALAAIAPRKPGRSIPA